VAEWLVSDARLSNEQIIGVLKQHETGTKVDDLCRRARRQQRDFLHLAEEVRRRGGE